MKKKVLVSACLLGKNCRYDGGHSRISELDDFDVDWVPVCPEEAGGLGTPRPAAEMQKDAESILKGNGSVINNNEKNVTEKFIQGAEESLKTGLISGAKYAILKSDYYILFSNYSGFHKVKSHIYFSRWSSLWVSLLRYWSKCLPCSW